MPEGWDATTRDIDEVHYEISMKEDEMPYQDFLLRMNFNKKKPTSLLSRDMQKGRAIGFFMRTPWPRTFSSRGRPREVSRRDSERNDNESGSAKDVRIVQIHHDYSSDLIQTVAVVRVRDKFFAFVKVIDARSLNSDLVGYSLISAGFTVLNYPIRPNRTTFLSQAEGPPNDHVFDCPIGPVLNAVLYELNRELHVLVNYLSLFVGSLF
ncbi:uncharacterized protein LOC143892538 isoform X2 [Tasmannia lanceolata]|uniref:uncharacterized protein LOC143892538 isoform X2 n=1 Tax=Tasmannia lanceolata TaxID=3420 RepID=UPI0040647D57